MKQRITNAKIVNEGSIVEGDLVIDGDRIEGINTPPSDGEVIIDAEGGFLIPGMIDDQGHFREPGFEHKAEIATESRAAVAGGITSYMEMPNCNPLTISEEKLIESGTEPLLSPLPITLFTWALPMTTWRTSNLSTHS